jgi:hypothetical protein
MDIYLYLNVKEVDKMSHEGLKLEQKSPNEVYEQLRPIHHQRELTGFACIPHTQQQINDDLEFARLWAHRIVHGKHGDYTQFFKSPQTHQSCLFDSVKQWLKKLSPF